MYAASHRERFILILFEVILASIKKNNNEVLTEHLSRLGKF